VTVFEQSRARSIAPGRLEADGGTVRAAVVIRATEAWTPRLPGRAREIAPLYSMVIATEPLPAPVWDEIGWRERSPSTTTVA